MSDMGPNPLPPLVQQLIAAASRHVLTGLAGVLATACGASHDQQVQFVGGGTAAIVFLAGLGWSFVQKHGAQQSLKSAVTAGVIAGAAAENILPTPTVASTVASTEASLSKGQF